MFIFMLIYIFIFMLSLEIFTVLFQISGLSREKARFQVLSLLTSSGFKTKESEIITNDIYKRKIAMALMIFTYVSLLVFISSLVYLAVKGDILTFFVYAICEIILFYNVFTILAIKKIIYRIVLKFSKKYILEKNINTLKVLEEFNNKVICQIWIENLPEEFTDIEISKVEQMSTLDISILAVERPNLLINSVQSSQKLLVGDKITIYGDLVNVKFLFKV